MLCGTRRTGSEAHPVGLRLNLTVLTAAGVLPGYFLEKALWSRNASGQIPWVTDIPWACFK